MHACIPDPFEITSEPEPGQGLRLRVRGDVDLQTAGALQEALDRGAARATHVVLDLSEVGFMDSTGVALLLRAEAAARADGFDLAVVPNATVLRVLALCRIDGLLTLRDS